MFYRLPNGGPHVLVAWRWRASGSQTADRRRDAGAPTFGCDRDRDAGVTRVLGVDPGLTRCGIGVVEAEPGRPPVFVAAGVVRTSPDADHAHRLLGIENGLLAWFDEYRPDAVAVERVFAQHNVASVTGTAQAAGIAMLIAARRNLPIALHTPSEVKAAITGSGRADKAQVQVMVARVLHLAEAPRPADAADALALAICHVWRGTAVNRYAEAAALASTRRTYTRSGQVRTSRPRVGTRHLGPAAADPTSTRKSS